MPTIGLPETTGSEIVLNCRSPHVMDVVPTFYTAEGTPIVGQTIHLKPAEIRFVNVDDLIPTEHRGQQRWGGMSLSYTGRFMEVWAQLTLRGVSGRNSVDVLFTVINSPRSNVREAVWRMPPGSMTSIALGNFSEATTTATLTFSDGEIQSVTIEPFATEIVRRRANGRGEGESVTINSSGPLGRLITSGFITTANRSFTSSIRFFDTENIGQPNLYATNFRLRNTAPHLLLKNTTTAAVTARPRFLSAVGETGDPVELPSVTVPANGVIAVNLRPLMVAARQREDLASTSVQIINSGAPGSLIGALYSTDAATGITYDVPFRDVANPRTSTGGYPVRLEGDFTTVLSITNVSEKTSKFTIQINYEGGTYALHPREIAAGATAMFDIRRLRDEQVPDSTGRTLPLSLTIGQIRWSVNGDDSTRLIGRAEVVSVSGKVSNSYSCMCCPSSVYDARIIRGGVFNQPGDTAQFFAMQRDQDCYGNIFGEYGASSLVWWASGDDSMVSVNFSSGEATAIDAGSAYVQGSWTAYEWHEDLHGTCESTPVQMEPISDTLVNSPEPHHVRVIADQSGFPVDCPDTGVRLRQLNLQVVNRNNRNVTSAFSVQESYSNVSTNTCGNGQPIPASCQPTEAGKFGDGLAVTTFQTACNSGINRNSGCGFTLTSTWSVCSGFTARDIWTSTRETRSNDIKVNGQSATYAAGTQLFP